MPPITLTLVVAVAQNGVIGLEGRLPWRIRSDLKYFRRVTMNRPVIMGRKTWPSVGKPLPGRTTIVVTRQKDFALPGVLVAPGLQEALAAARGDALRRGVNDVAIIGGTEIFRQTMPVADRLLLTWVHANPPGDTYFPEIDAKLWREIERLSQPQGPDDDHGFTFATYERTAS